MKGLLIAMSIVCASGCVSQIFLDGPVDPSARDTAPRIVHVTPVPTTCPQPGMGNCYLVTDGQGGAQRLLEAPSGVLQYTPGTDYVVEVTERPLSGSGETRWVVSRVVDRHPRAR
ncbi:hypothetical protein [Lysobacter arvi]|uniref:DUF4377 domain-containing protein n=1 Tax=Lysobacter arvi TaxID=3038776 RepID=A0ABU1C9X3_9GAMM|nr:hypothetical protein [Lysobacter arvi]MDR0181983.1 hypothetical protein [Lysobacter arvi]